jgi:hypothetical protein
MVSPLRIKHHDADVLPVGLISPVEVPDVGRYMAGCRVYAQIGHRE